MTRSANGLVISLDFELAWGMRDLEWAPGYEAHLRGARDLVPWTVSLFEEAGIRATWAMVGALGLESVEELAAAFLGDPAYLSRVLDAGHLPVSGRGEFDQLHFAPGLVELVLSAPQQSAGSHTFLHTVWTGSEIGEIFDADLRSARSLPWGATCTALVFPRNSYDPSALTIAKRCGFEVFRGVPETRSWTSDITTMNRSWRRVLRLGQSFTTGTRSYRVDPSSSLSNVRASRFLRPPLRSRALNERHVGVIKREMSAAAANDETYHLWWHPHNHGRHREAAQAMLISIVGHWARLNEEHGWPSLPMGQAA